MGLALREISSGPMVALLRAKTSDIKSTIVPNNPKNEKEGVKVVSVPSEDHIRIQVANFRELRGADNAPSDVWEFRVIEQHPQTKTDVVTLWYVLGADILCLMAMSKVI